MWYAATYTAKRKQHGCRGSIQHRKTKSPEDDAVACAEVNTMGIDTGEILTALAVSVRPAHAVQK